MRLRRKERKKGKASRVDKGNKTHIEHGENICIFINLIISPSVVNIYKRQWVQA